VKVIFSGYAILEGLLKIENKNKEGDNLD